MNADRVRRQLEALGADLETVCIVPLGSKMDGLKRDSKTNLIETLDCYIVAGYERGQVFGEGFCKELDAACANMAEGLDEDPAKRRQAAKEHYRRVEQYRHQGG